MGFGRLRKIFGVLVGSQSLSLLLLFLLFPLLPFPLPLQVSATFAASLVVSPYIGTVLERR